MESSVALGEAFISRRWPILRVLCAQLMPIGLILMAVACGSTPASQSRAMPVVEHRRLDRPADDPRAHDRCRALQSAAVRADAPPIYLTSEVDEPAQMLPLAEQSHLPALPHRHGDAMAVVVVQPTGRAQAASVQVVRSSNEDLRTIVTAIVTYARYRPAKRAGVAVAHCLVVSWND